MTDAKHQRLGDRLGTSLRGLDDIEVGSASESCIPSSGYVETSDRKTNLPIP